MKKLHFTYDMQIKYDIAVNSCDFTIKCFPVDTVRQRIENLAVRLTPETNYQWGVDGLGNKQIWGTEKDSHDFFRFQIEGDAITDLAEYEEDENADLSMIFSVPHGLNIAGDSIKKLYREKIEQIEKGTFDKVQKITEILFDAFRYESGSTNVDTSAEEAFRQGCGVCQDYAHILISLLHLSRIKARYVTGFIIGEGESHAWVEFLDGDKWYGIDPTHNRLINGDYIKIGHGRDAKDCLINRGLMHGGGYHTQTVNVNVQEL